jgi:hypothetical protein
MKKLLLFILTICSCLNVERTDSTQYLHGKDTLDLEIYEAKPIGVKIFVPSQWEKMFIDSINMLVITKPNLTSSSFPSLAGYTLTNYPDTASFYEIIETYKSEFDSNSIAKLITFKTSVVDNYLTNLCEIEMSINDTTFISRAYHIKRDKDILFINYIHITQLDYKLFYDFIQKKIEL